MKNKLLFIGGVINLATALLHTLAGQVDLVRPLLNSSLTVQQQAEWTGAWHMVTILLFLSSFALLYFAKSGVTADHQSLVKAIGLLYILFALPSMVASVYFWVFAPQWVLLLPIGLLAWVGARKTI